MQVINCGSNTLYYRSQHCILISWNSRLIADLIFSVFDYYNLTIKRTVYNSVIWSGADVLMLVYFLFLHFRMNENPSTIFEYWSFVFWILVKKLWQELPFSKNMLLLFFSNKLFFKKFIYKSILSMIFLKIIYNIECSIFRKKNSFDETFPLTIVNNPL